MFSQIVYFSHDLFKFILQQCKLKAILYTILSIPEIARYPSAYSKPLTSHSQKTTKYSYQLSQTASGKTCLIIFQCSNTPLS